MVTSRGRPPAAPPTLAPPQPDRTTVGLGIGVVLVAGLVYLRTAARDIVVGDTPELITAAFSLGVAHPPGYPLFTLLGHAFSLLPLDPLPFRLHLFAVACHIGTVGLVYLTAWRLGSGPLAAAVAALLLAFNPLFWSWSLVAEVFPLNNVIAAGLILLLVLWEQQPQRRAWLAGAALLFGLGLTNHQTIALLVPGILYLLWRHRARLSTQPRFVGVCAALLLLGLTPYLYVPWAAARAPVLNWGDIANLEDFVALLTRQQYGTGQLVTSGALAGGSPMARLGAWLASFTLLEGLLLLVGGRAAWRWRRWYLTTTLLLVALAGPGFALYANINLDLNTLFVLERFFLLSHIVLAPLAALGIALVVSAIGGRVTRFGRRAVAGAVAGLVLVLLSGTAVTSFAAIDQSNNHVARTTAEDALATLDPNSILYVSGDHLVLPLLYLQVVEAQRPDVRVVIQPLLTSEWYVRQVARRMPDVRLPFRQADGRADLFAAIVQANGGRPFATFGLAQDHSVRETHWYYNRGLVLQVEPRSTSLTVRQIVDENERLLRLYHIPTEVRDNPFERELRGAYARIPFRVGAVVEDAQLPFAAEIWYQRSIAIDPTYGPGYRGLGGLELARGNRDAAATYLRTALTHNPSDTEARDLLQRAVTGP